MDNNTVILQSTLPSLQPQPTVIVQAPPSNSGHILELVTTGNNNNSVISRVYGNDGNTYITSSNENVPGSSLNQKKKPYEQTDDSNQTTANKRMKTIVTNDSESVQNQNQNRITS